jgi:polysaccharide biosynthesis transport protein
MLKRVDPLHDPAVDLRLGAAEDQGLGIKDIVAFLRRRAWTITVPLLIALSAATWYILNSQPLYTASAELMLETQRQQLVQQQPITSEISLDAAFVGSQIEVLRSEGLLLSVVENLSLDEDPQFVGESTGLLSSMKQFFHADEEVSKKDLALIRLLNGLHVQRVGQTYVIEIAYESSSPGTAIRITNAVAEAYILDALNSRQVTAQRTTAWLRDRVNELREEALNADRMVQDFKVTNRVTDAGGQLILEQQVTELSKQIMAAQAQTAEAKARLDEFGTSSQAPERAADVTRSNITDSLRQQYSELTRRYAEYSTRFGRDHATTVAVRDQMQQLEQSSAEGLRSEYQVALARETAIQGRLDSLTRDLANARQAQVALPILESSAQTYHTLHSNFLQRLVERSQQRSFPSGEARVITPAVRAESKPPSRIVIVAGFLGLAIGFGIAIAKEIVTPTLRTPKQVEQAIGIECLGLLPTLRVEKRIKPQQGGNVVNPERLVSGELGLLHNVIMDPFSRFADTMRKLQIATELESEPRHANVIGIVSALTGEGKTTVSANLAQLLAKGGRRTLLIDGNLHDRTLSQWMAPGAETGFMQVITGKARLVDITWRDPLTDLEFLPAFVDEPIADASQVLSSEGMTRLIERAKEEYQYVVIDFPEMASLVDAKAAAHLVDAFLLVIQWNETSPDVVREVLSAAEIIQRKTVAAVLNRADRSAFKQL